MIEFICITEENQTPHDQLIIEAFRRLCEKQDYPEMEN